MPSNLNIKYGNKASIPDLNAGNILAAENNTGNIEMYIDTPKASGSERKRLDPRIFVGGLSDVNIPGDSSATDAAKRAAIWENYDVWIDTDGDPTGTATTTSDGLMSSTHVDTLTRTYNTLNALKAELDKLKLQIVSQSYWNDDESETGSSSGEALENMLTIVLPDSAVPSGETASEYIFNTVDTSSIVVPTIDLARNNSDGFGNDGGSGS